MSTVTDRVETPRNVVNPTRMVHRSYDWERTVALCGARLRGITHPHSTPVDCHVCTEIARSRGEAV